MKFDIGPQVVSQYKRANYQPWFAIGEFVDNSTQSYLNNKKVLDKKYSSREEMLEVSVNYDRSKGLIVIADNAMGMDEKELDEALYLGKKPVVSDWRSKYGFGMKAAAFWFGDEWQITSKKLGSSQEITVEVSLEKIIKGETDLDPKFKEVDDLEDSYTVITISKLNQKPHGRTLGKMREYLQSMYRVDLREQRMKLSWRGQSLTWDLGESGVFATAADGSEYRKDISFEIKSEGKKKKIFGWVGVLDSGSRQKGGFSLLHADRVVKGYPDAWKPGVIFGEQEGGSNNLVTQRLVGELHMNDFDVTVTKDGIQWFEEEEELVEEGLKKACADYVQFAKDRRKSKEANRIEQKVAVDQFNEELNSPDLVDAIRFSVPKQPELIRADSEPVIAATSNQEADFSVAWNDGEKDLTIKGFLSDNLSRNDPYVYQESARTSEVVVVINMSHPVLDQVQGAENIRQHIRECVYDAIAEWKALHISGNVDATTIRNLKDHLLRIGISINS